MVQGFGWDATSWQQLRIFFCNLHFSSFPSCVLNKCAYIWLHSKCACLYTAASFCLSWFFFFSFFTAPSGSSAGPAADHDDRKQMAVCHPAGTAPTGTNPYFVNRPNKSPWQTRLLVSEEAHVLWNRPAILVLSDSGHSLGLSRALLSFSLH